jgi:hypothetical protein
MLRPRVTSSIAWWADPFASVTDITDGCHHVTAYGGAESMWTNISVAVRGSPRAMGHREWNRLAADRHDSNGTTYKRPASCEVNPTQVQATDPPGLAIHDDADCRQPQTRRNCDRCSVTGVDVSYERHDAVAAKPPEHRSGSLCCVAVALMGDANDPPELGPQLPLLEQQRGLNDPDSDSIDAFTYDPVQPTVRFVGRAPGDLPGVSRP